MGLPVAGRRPSCTRTSALLGLAAAGLGAAALLLRSFEAAPRDASPGSALGDGAELTGLGLLLGGLAFVALHRAPQALPSRLFAVAAALGVVAVGSAALIVSQAQTGVAVPIAVVLVLIGFGAAWATRREGGGLAVQVAGFSSLAIALLLLIGRAYSARPLYEVAGTLPARPWAALGCALLALALLLCRPEYALSRVLAARTLGADHLRRALPALLAVPLATGLLTLAGLRAGWYGTSVAFTLFTLIAMAALALLGAASARRIDAIAGERAALEGLFQRTFDNAFVGVARIDPEARWQRVNARLVEIVGWPVEELVGRHFAEITHAEDVHLDHEALAAFARGEVESQQLEKRYVTKQGHVVWADVLVSAEREPDGAITSFIVVVRDISARKRAERANDEFFATVSHELRSSLHVLGSWLPVLRDESDPARRARALAVVERSAGVLNRLIGDLLDASRIVTGKFEIEREAVDLEEVVRAVVTAFQPLADSRGVALALEVPPQSPFVSGDSQRLEQVVRNLLDNALKFTESGGRIGVQLALAGGRVSIAVSDTGRGIAPELLPHVFRRFTRGERGTHGAGHGLGLGLWIVRHLVELHGGAVEARSEGAGRGSTFAVTLPEIPIPQRLAPVITPEPESDALDGVRVLLVKPDRIAAEALALAFEAADASVAWTRSCEAALDQARQRPPRVVVADLDLAYANWPEWLRDLRAASPRPLAAIALSAGDRPSGQRRARSAGFDAFLGRPFEARRLVAVAHGLIEGRRRVLVVDDEPDAADSLAILLARQGFDVERAYSVASALAAAGRFEPHAVITDLRLGAEDGVTLARELRLREAGPRCIVALSGRAGDELGADRAVFDGFASKPVELDALVAVLRSRS